MARLPDRFDLWVHKARTCADPARQADYILGALAALREWYFLNQGTKENPQPAKVEMEGTNWLLLFSAAGRMEELLREKGQFQPGEPLPVIAIPTESAMTWCLEDGNTDCAGLMVNPGEAGALIPMDHLKAFHEEWVKRGARAAAGFWIPHMTTQEEDFWQENGL